MTSIAALSGFKLRHKIQHVPYSFFLFAPFFSFFYLVVDSFLIYRGIAVAIVVIFWWLVRPFAEAKAATQKESWTRALAAVTAYDLLLLFFFVLHLVQMAFTVYRLLLKEKQCPHRLAFLEQEAHCTQSVCLCDSRANFHASVISVWKCMFS